LNEPESRPLLPNVSQFEVDFVIPRVGLDLPLGIDPFLLFKSRHAGLRRFHSLIVGAFNAGVAAVREGRFDTAKRIFDFPEAAEIGFGYTKAGKRGSGVGTYLAQLILETLAASPALLDRGVRHVEEMQLVSLGIGPDRISDIAANLLKSNLIEYTQEQCAIWGISIVRGVPVRHVFDADSLAWFDGYFDLPVSPIDGSPILLVPRRIVRALPWINYDDFVRAEFSTYLRAKQVKKRMTVGERKALEDDKAHVVAVARAEVERVDRYVRSKEATAALASPSVLYLEGNEECRESELLKSRLASIPTGAQHAGDYQRLVLEVLNFLFNPDLIDGELEVRTVEGTERRDIIFTNDSDLPFWSYVRSEHSGILLMFEVKNTDALETGHINQTATYLGDRLGRLGFIVTRNGIQATQQLKLFSVFNDSNPRKVILVVSDQDLELMLDMKCQGKPAWRHIQRLYRTFRTSVQ